MITITQIQKEKAADLILKYNRLGGDRMLQETIDKLDLIINPHLSTPTGSSTLRDRVALFIKDYASGKGKYSLEITIDEITKILQSTSGTYTPKKTINMLYPPTTQKPLKANKYFAGTSRFSQKQIDALNLVEVNTEQQFKDVIETVIDERCIHKTSVYKDGFGNYSYHVEITDTGKNMILFQFSRSRAGKGLEPAEVVLGMLKSFYDSYTGTCSGILKYDHLTGRIAVV